MKEHTFELKIKAPEEIECETLHEWIEEHLDNIHHENLEEMDVAWDDAEQVEIVLLPKKGEK